MRDPLTDKAIELYALYETPQSIFKIMKAEYGEESLTAGTIKNIRTKHRPEIVKKRQELMAKIPVLDPMERFAYLQKIIDGALEGTPIFHQGVEIGTEVDYKNALAALKIVHEQTHIEGAINTDDDELIRNIVQEAFDEMKAANPKMSDSELLDRMLSDLPDGAKVFVEELKVEVANG